MPSGSGPGSRQSPTGSEALPAGTPPPSDSLVAVCQSRRTLVKVVETDLPFGLTILMLTATPLGKRDDKPLPVKVIR